MTKNSIDLLCYLESKLVFHQGFFHEDKLSDADRAQIVYWEGQDILQVEKLPPPRTGEAAYTHRVRFSDRAWRIAHKARRKKAEYTTPTGPASQNGQLQNRRDESHSSLNEDDTESTSIPAYEGFTQWLEARNHRLTEPQADSARMIFEIMNMDNLKFFWSKSASGKSWLLKAIDQYITDIQQ